LTGRKFSSCMATIIVRSRMSKRCAICTSGNFLHRPFPREMRQEDKKTWSCAACFLAKHRHDIRNAICGGVWSSRKITEEVRWSEEKAVDQFRGGSVTQAYLFTLPMLSHFYKVRWNFGVLSAVLFVHEPRSLVVLSPTSYVSGTSRHDVTSIVSVARRHLKCW
jgi:hypothetical protein